ncbi:methyltransferase domain-containing protein [Nonomuraea soli]|uniref:SAM-dependent methyltransferase n=1 Tax=Nonomuraea soli TaxID=1032476 RepID=A0A7W0HMS3_9ACTN|nr:methyltransferase domain-containing protein [Nonomuraea soli]MBA2889060.1 SAM-dependent methyltransferase [Nonomuraea soli]
MTRDAMQHINEQDQATLRRFVDRLEARGRDPRFTAFRDSYLAELPPEGEVLEVGCGTGVVARALARVPGYTVTGVDQSPVLLEAARGFAAAEGLKVDFRRGDAHALDFPSASFDVLVAHTLISHVADPARVLREARRVVRPGGVVAVFDGDYASLTFACADHTLGRAMEEALLAVVVSQPRVMRDLPELLRACGLELVEVQGHLLTEVGGGGFFLGLAETFSPLTVREGLISDDEQAVWLAGLKRAGQRGTFFAACAYYGYVARAA